MANIDVQVKKKSSILPWLLLAAGIAALIWFLTRNNDRDEVTTTGPANTTLNSTTNNAAAADDGWDIDWNAPAVTYNEITGGDIQVRGNDNYAIYGLEENILFDTDQATLRSDAADKLKQVTASIQKRYNGGQVRIYGYTDAEGSASHNQELSKQRAEAVKNWLTQNGMNAANLSVHARGENNPVASNATEEGKQQNRRVEIIARKA